MNTHFQGEMNIFERCHGAGSPAGSLFTACCASRQLRFAAKGRPRNFNGVFEAILGLSLLLPCQAES